ncbi:hypothetical protein BDB00DRAFT_839543 [Zychaea mexicana]|uniref:uncharacterized protein n=1 Tax=Zychaea mexicana TaxID=64656 RepID=UPI0022FDF856|nr:uncharacterized protein BDB00DRAFT_839543 [Zychaea mexicana]KAI9490088.1 hypothetical protein BDB00DRAFT_839543 [Zychaea mexicana]
MNELYTRKSVTMDGVQAAISPFSTFFDEKSSLGFAQWCSRNNLSLCKSETIRRESTEGPGRQRVRYRTLYVLEEAYHGIVAESIKTYIPKFRQQIKQMKQDNHTIVGYCRKSVTDDDHPTRVRLLRQTVQKLKARSLVDRVYISPRSSANQEIRSRDFMESDFIISDIEGAIGTTQGKWKYFSRKQSIRHNPAFSHHLSTALAGMDTGLECSLLRRTNSPGPFTVHHRAQLVPCSSLHTHPTHLRRPEYVRFLLFGAHTGSWFSTASPLTRPSLPSLPSTSTTNYILRFLWMNNGSYILICTFFHYSCCFLYAFHFGTPLP